MKKTYIIFLWHQHQPYYKNNLSGKYILPWVRLHSIKDYYDTVAVIEKYPKIKLNFNLVPSLLLQIQDYVENNARDNFYYISMKNATELTDEDKIFILRNFFMCNWETMINIYPRYSQLLDLRGRNKKNEDFGMDIFLKNTDLQNLDVNYYRDLQVWFNLSWIDPSFRNMENFKFLEDLIKKGECFTENEKHLVLASHIEIMKMIIPKYKKLLKKKQIEISTTPFYHPILPLLVDNSIAKVSNPNKESPKNIFQYPKDAISQIKNGIDFFEKIFEEKPKGMWPSEGSVSDAVLDIFQNQGIKWIASDEDVLFQSLEGQNYSRNELYYGYRYKNSDLHIFFRDKKLSDLIGFSYSKMNAIDAVNNFFENLYNIKNSLPQNDDNENVISIILDGENCWEYFINDGNDFLNELYKKFQDSEDFETITISEFIENHKIKKSLDNIYPASWINHNFDIWIGNKEDNEAWELLQKTREFLEQTEKNFKNGIQNKFINEENIKKAFEEIYIAEGSDWFWWYGDDHNSENDAEFDELFRQHLKNVYTILGQYIPEKFYIPITKIENFIQNFSYLEQIDFINPIIDGKESNFFEWHNAAVFFTDKNSGSMHQVVKIVKKFYYGFDKNFENFYFRIDLNDFFENINEKEIIVSIIFGDIMEICININIDETSNDYKKIYCCSINSLKKEQNLNFSYNILDINGEISFKNCIELKIPLKILAEKLNFDKKNNENLEFIQSDKIELKLKVFNKNKNIELEEYPLYQNKIFIENKFFKS
ncbi:MAG: glycoside hydrolase [Elusimicrobiota bacterium]|jgi:alpha-amylase/alpha-mannosidase (GH57 family)|nr:glycoside hydrolase [Elusimicrobiota bacterium]